MVKPIYLLAVISLLYTFELLSEPRWVNLTGIPQSNSRKDDLFFINPNTGWVVTNQGQVYRTLDGGISWLQF